jgi:hypothetical protein
MTLKKYKFKDAANTIKDSADNADNHTFTIDSCTCHRAATEKLQLNIKILKSKIGDSGEIYYQAADFRSNSTKTEYALILYAFVSKGTLEMIMR